MWLRPVIVSAVILELLAFGIPFRLMSTDLFLLLWKGNIKVA